MEGGGWDSRRNTRILVETQALFRLHRSIKKEMHFSTETVASKIVDLSASGCALESPFFVPVNTKINLFVERSVLAGNGKFKNKFSKISGVVKNIRQLPSRKYRIGLLFANISKDDVALIKDYVDQVDRRQEKRITL